MVKPYHLRRALAPAVLLVLLACACGAGTPAPPEAAPDARPTVTVPAPLPAVVAVWSHLEEQEGADLGEWTVALERDNPDLRVELVRAPAADERRRERFESALAAGDSTVDVYAILPDWLPGLSTQDWLVPLDGRLDLEGFAPEELAAYTVGGRLLALPWRGGQGLALSAFSLRPAESLRVMAALAAER